MHLELPHRAWFLAASRPQDFSAGLGGKLIPVSEHPPMCNMCKKLLESGEGGGPAKNPLDIAWDVSVLRAFRASSVFRPVHECHGSTVTRPQQEAYIDGRRTPHPVRVV